MSPSTTGPTRHPQATVFSTVAGGPPGRQPNPFTPPIKASDDEIELTPAQIAACWLAVRAAAAAGTVIDAALLDEIETKALAGEQLAGVDPVRARRSALVRYFGLPA